MSEETAVRLAESNKGMQAVIISGVVALMHIEDCEKLDRVGQPLTLLARDGVGNILHVDNGN